jgi:hypothetical protein
MALTALHNFIRKYNSDPVLECWIQNTSISEPDSRETQYAEKLDDSCRGDQEAQILRDQISNEM